MKFFEIHTPYYALLKAETQEEAITTYTEFVAEDDGTLNEEIKEVERDYALALYSRCLSEEDEQVPILEVLTKFQSNERSVLLIDSGVL